MKITALRAAHLDDLYNVYRQATVSMPHCRFTPSRNHFQASLMHPAQPTTQIFVAEDEERAVGFATLLSRGNAPDGAREATISALFVQDGAGQGADVGQALLDACLLQARALNIQRLLAFASDHQACPIISYNAGWDGLSDCLPWVGRLLAKNRFMPYHRELHLVCNGEFFPPSLARSTAPIQLLKRTELNGHQTLAASLGDQEVGDCEYSSLAEISDDPRAAQCGYIWGLYVAPECRQQGIARHLLTMALDQLAQQHCTSCWLTTASDNWAAQPLYLALGFEIVDTSTSFRKTLMTG